uniref:GRIP1 associated protein 1 n=1 Tax=Takifugu rubripes TaxID=31033 RepID=H2UAU8_TAKRU
TPLQPSSRWFHRIHLSFYIYSLLKILTQNYKLSDDLRKTTAELHAVRQKNVGLERDFIKAQKEVEALLGENEMLQGKLHSQEEDFRLQNSTLMTELSKLCTQIEELEQENKGLKEAGGGGSSATSNAASSPVDGELLRLQAENATLQKQMKGVQLYLPQGAGQLCQKSPRQDRIMAVGLSEKSVEKIVAKQAALGWSAALCPITHCFGPELEMALNTEQEEKRLLKEQIQHLERRIGHFPLFCYCQTHFSRIWVILQILTSCSVCAFPRRTKIDELNQRKEEEVKALNSCIQKLQSDVAAASQTSAELKEELQSKEKEHESALQNLKDQAAKQSAVSQERVDNILQENDALRTNLAALEQIQTVKTQEMNLLREQQEALTAELSQRRAEYEALSAQRDDLASQLQESSFANRKLLEQLTEEGHEKDRLLTELDEAKKTAEKRKAMLDEMAIQLNQEKSNHKEALSDLKLQHEKEILGVRARYEKELRGLHEDKNRSEEEIRQQLRDEKARTKELEGLQLRVEELQAQVMSMEGTKGWFERRLKEAEVIIIHCPLSGHGMERLKEQLVEVEKQRDELNNTIGKLRQVKMNFRSGGFLIIIMRSGGSLKDLKRQLQLERKRADKLQERLQEILTNTKTRTGLEELVLSEINSPSRSQPTGDSSSVSSFSYKDMMKETQTTNQNKSGGGSPQSQRPADLSDDEVSELFQRLAEVQQEKWMLEEKVKHLEVSCSSMAEDICRKSAIIETYVMDSRIDVSGSVAGGYSSSQGDRGGLGSVLRDLVKPGDENLREMNKKLQNMLEEQLTKNMHLQKDLELLSQELVRLGKDSAPAGSTARSE